MAIIHCSFPRNDKRNSIIKTSLKLFSDFPESSRFDCTLISRLFRFPFQNICVLSSTLCVAIYLQPTSLGFIQRPNAIQRAIA